MDLRKSVVLLKDLFALSYYDNFIKAYEIYPQEFTLENSRDPEYPEFWLRGFIIHLLQSLDTVSSLDDKNTYCKIIYSFFIKYKDVLDMPRYKEKFKPVTTNKAKELLSNENCSEDNIAILKKFLELYTE